MKKNEKSSIYYGVCVYKTNQFQVQLCVNNIKISLGHFYNETDAAIAYDNYVRENNLNRRLNFPDPEPENIIPNTRLIRLTRGKFAIVDDEDYEYLNQFNWHVTTREKNNYVQTRCKINGKSIPVTMHELILKLPNVEIDHINGNGLHNYKSNFRPCTHQQNTMNQRKRIGCRSEFKGTNKCSNSKKYQSAICKDGKRMYLGSFDTEIEAAKCYDQYAKELFGEFACLNFPD